MPLSNPAPREAFHHRSVDYRGYRREDGLWDIEAHLSDTKAYTFDSSFRGTIEPGEPIHDMRPDEARCASYQDVPWPRTCHRVCPRTNSADMTAQTA